MALNPVYRLRILKMSLDMLRARKQSVLEDKIVLIRQATVAADIETQVDTLYSSLLVELDAAITRVTNAISAIVPTNAEKVAFADIDVAASKA